MEIGDNWRKFSLFAARIGKNRDLGPEKMKQLSEMLYELAGMEENFFKDLYQTV